MRQRPEGVLVIGAGGHALVSIEVLRAAGHDVAGCLSTDGSAGADLDAVGTAMLGRTDELADLLGDDGVDVFVAVGDNHARQRLADDAGAVGARLVSAVSPDAVVSPSATIGHGVLVMPGVVVNASASIADGVILNTGAAVDHECAIGAFAHLGPRSTLTGRVTVGEGALVGAGAVVTPGCTIGGWSVVGAGSVVVADVTSETTVAGVPTRVLRAAPAREVERSVPAVLLVCTGNLCRSPLAAALLARGLADAGVKADVRSVGTAAPLGQSVDRKQRRVADELGVDLGEHRAFPITADVITAADLVLTMTAAHTIAVADLEPAAATRTVTLRAAAWRSTTIRDGPMPFADWVARLARDVPVVERPRFDPVNDLPDPVGGPWREYRAVGEEIDALVSTLVEHWSGR